MANSEVAAAACTRWASAAFQWLLLLMLPLLLLQMHPGIADAQPFEFEPF